METGTKKRLQDILDWAVENRELAGGSLLVLRDGREVCYVEAGMADREAGRPVTRDKIYRLYSMSKPITAAAAMKLVEEGLLDLGEPVAAFFPSYANQAVVRGQTLTAACREMTVQDLLHMTSGLVYGGRGDLPARYMDEVFEQIDSRLLGDNPVTTAEFASLLGRAPLAFEPGESWRYGTSADVLGAVVEAVSGKRFGDYLEEAIFRPLGMRATGFFVPEENRSRLVTAYERDEEGGLIPYRGNHLGIINAMDRRPGFESGGAGLVSTVDDYARFAQMLLNGGQLDGVRILRPKTVEFMTGGALNGRQEEALEAYFPNLCGYGYGCLMRIMKAPGRARTFGHAGEYGWDGWLGCHFLNDAAMGLTFVFMMQQKDTGTTPVVRKLRNAVISEG